MAKLCTEIPHQFATPCSQLLSHILSFCLHDDAETRNSATKAFGAYILSGPLSPESLEYLQTFISSHYKHISSLFASSLQQNSKSTTGINVPDRSNVSGTDDSARAPSFRWALSFCTALVTSLKSKIFSHVSALRLVVRFLMSAREYPKSRIVRVGARMAWRTLIWAYADLPMGDEKQKDFADMVFKTVKQGDLSGGIGAALVGTLIHLSHRQQNTQPVSITESGSYVDKALQVLRELIFMSKRPDMARDGIVMLQHILFPSPMVSQQWVLDGIVERAFLDGRVIDGQWNGLEASTQALVSSVPSLTESDLGADGKPEAATRLLSDIFAIQAQDHQAMVSSASVLIMRSSTERNDDLCDYIVRD
jgi:hypothetical protein